MPDMENVLEEEAAPENTVITDGLKTEQVSKNNEPEPDGYKSNMPPISDDEPEFISQYERWVWLRGKGRV